MKKSFWKSDVIGKRNFWKSGVIGKRKEEKEERQKGWGIIHSPIYMSFWKEKMIRKNLRGGILKIGAYQFSINSDIDYNLAVIKSSINQAVQKGV